MSRLIVFLLAVAGILAAIRARADEPLETTRRPEFDAYFERLVAERRIPGAAVIVLRRGKPLHEGVYGWANVETHEPMRRDTLVRIASMTKPVTSVAIMQLADHGRLAVTDPVSKYIPAFANPRVLTNAAKSEGPDETRPADREITIHDLLTHTSGLGYGVFAPPRYANLLKAAEIGQGLNICPWTVEENCDRIARLPLMFSPGERWGYGLSTDVLGRVVEVASGMPLEKYFAAELFQPLGMQDTFFFTPPEKESRRAVLYDVGPDKKIFRAADQARADWTVLEGPGPDGKGPRRYCSGGGGLVSSADDYLRFLKMLLNDGELDGARILKPETVRRMTTNRSGNVSLGIGDHGDQFGYGFGVWTEKGQKNGVPTVGSYSWSGAFSTYFWIDPSEQVIGLLMTQMSRGDHVTIRDDLKRLTYDAIRSSGDSAAPAR